MNTILTLLIYNPLEAFFLIRFCDIIIGRNFIKKDIFNCYFLGFINYMIQCLPNLFYGKCVFSLIQTICVLLILPLTLFMYYNRFINRIRITYCIMSYILLFILVTISCFILLPSVINCIYYIEVPIVVSLIELVVLTCFEIISLNIIKVGIKYEKDC